LTIYISKDLVWTRLSDEPDAGFIAAKLGGGDGFNDFGAFFNT
jgi:hypothetical protein